MQERASSRPGGGDANQACRSAELRAEAGVDAAPGRSADPARSRAPAASAGDARPDGRPAAAAGFGSVLVGRRAAGAPPGGAGDRSRGSLGRRRPARRGARRQRGRSASDGGVRAGPHRRPLRARSVDVGAQRSVTARAGQRRRSPGPARRRECGRCHLRARVSGVAIGRARASADRRRRSEARHARRRVPARHLRAGAAESERPADRGRSRRRGPAPRPLVAGRVRAAADRRPTDAAGVVDARQRGAALHACVRGEGTWRVEGSTGSSRADAAAVERDQNGAGRNGSRARPNRGPELDRPAPQDHQRCQHRSPRAPRGGRGAGWHSNRGDAGRRRSAARHDDGFEPADARGGPQVAGGVGSRTIRRGPLRARSRSPLERPRATRHRAGRPGGGPRRRPSARDARRFGSARRALGPGRAGQAESANRRHGVDRSAQG